MEWTDDSYLGALPTTYTKPDEQVQFASLRSSGGHFDGLLSTQSQQPYDASELAAELADATGDPFYQNSGNDLWQSGSFGLPSLEDLMSPDEKALLQNLSPEELKLDLDTAFDAFTSEALDSALLPPPSPPSDTPTATLTKCDTQLSASSSGSDDEDDDEDDKDDVGDDTARLVNAVVMANQRKQAAPAAGKKVSDIKLKKIAGQSVICTACKSSKRSIATCGMHCNSDGTWSCTWCEVRGKRCKRSYDKRYIGVPKSRWGKK